MAALRDQLDTFWSRALDNYRDVVEPDTTEQDAVGPDDVETPTEERS